MQVVKKVAIFGIFQHDINNLFFFENFIKLDDIWVPESTMDKHLSLEVLLIGVGDFPLEVDLRLLVRFAYYDRNLPFSMHIISGMKCAWRV